MQCPVFNMKRILFIIAMLWGVAYGQTIGYLRYDSVKIYKQNGTGELILENSTKGVTGGVLTNMGNGRTQFVTPSGGTDVEGNLLFVDDIYGNNGTATANRPFLPYLTLAAAKAAATSGYTIVVRPGTYTVTASLAKDEVDWYFEPGAVVTYADDLVTTGIWDDGGAAMQFKVGGMGKFTRSSTDDVLAIKLVNVTHASSEIVIEADQLIATAGENAEASVIYQTAGIVNVNSRLITMNGGNSYAIWWFNGAMYVNTSKLYSDYSAFVSDVDAAPTGDAHIQAYEIVTPNVSSATGIGVGNTGTNADAAFWIHSNTIIGKIQSNGVNKVYVECQKIIGVVETQATTGFVYVTTDKIVDAGEGMIEINSGTVRINVDHLDPSTFNGDIAVTGGTLYLNGADYLGTATSDGLVISAGTAILTDVTINTAANASTFPITKSGGTLTIKNNLLTAQAAVNGISAPTAQTVISYGSVSNRPLDSDVVLSGDIVANSLSYSSNIASGVTANTLYYDATTEQITYGAAPSGSSGITVGTTTITSGTSGAIPFNNAGVYGEDAALLFWDNANNRLGVGTNAPTQLFHSQAAGTTALFKSTGYTSAGVIIEDPDGGMQLTNSQIKALAQPLVLNANASDIRLQTGGVEEVRITSTGLGSGVTPTTQLHTTAFAAGYRKVTADVDVIAATDYTLDVDNVGNNWTITLPTPIGCAGRIYIIKRFDETSTGTITIGTAAGNVQNIKDGTYNTTYDLEAWSGNPLPAIMFQSTGANWAAIK